MYRYVNYGGDTGHIERSRCMPWVSISITDRKRTYVLSRRMLTAIAPNDLFMQWRRNINAWRMPSLQSKYLSSRRGGKS